jgi:hypothetical protein
MENTVTIKLGESEIKDGMKPIDRYLYDVGPYARWFDETCMAWTKDQECNLFFLKTQQSYANELLKAKGHLFLNEVYDMLGIPRTRAGQVIGWIYDVQNPIGDNFVNFGLYEQYNAKFINGYEKSVLLDFNVDGEIISRI